MLDWMKEIVGNFGNWLLSHLPLSPFDTILSYLDPIHPYLKYLNWFVPIPWILSILTAWLGVIASFYLYSIIMRWIKMIGV